MSFYVEKARRLNHGIKVLRILQGDNHLKKIDPWIACLRDLRGFTGFKCNYLDLRKIKCILRGFT